jgi:crotonobetainyl-CoA:carnitine CoA-transferase CaiB-like acyl-CoA transferase
MLGCLGADVIKVESVSRPDLMRYTSTRPPTEDRWWEWGPLFHGANSNKRGITLDMTKTESVEILKRLIVTADVLLDNFTPRVMDQFGLTWHAVQEMNPSVVMVRMPAYGLDGPWRDRTGFAQTMESITGMAWVTGWPDGPPLLPRGACDPLAAMHAVFATFLALRDRDWNGSGHFLEITMIEAALNAAAEQVVEHSASGALPQRLGNHGATAAPQNVYQCSGDEEWVAVAVTTDDEWAGLCEVLDTPEWARAPELTTADGRRRAQDDIDTELTKWCAERDAHEVAEQLLAAGVPAGYVVDARDIASNPQLLHRGYFDEVLGGIVGLRPDELARLREEHVIGEHPVGL